MRSFRDKGALVTGAASGIGRAIAIALAREGARLCLLDIDEAGLARTAEAAACFNAEIITMVCDLSEPRQISASLDSLLSARTKLNILVNSAGVGHYGPIHLTSNDKWNRVISVNLLAPIQLVRELFATLAAQDEAHILNVCSMFGLVPSRRIAAYQTSKFGLVGFTQALRAEYSRPGFGITCLCPGFVRTPMIYSFKKDGIARQPSPPPAWIVTSSERVAGRALWAMRKNKGMVVVTPVAKLAWWLARFSPAACDWFVRDGWRARGHVPVSELRVLEEERVQASRPPT